MLATLRSVVELLEGDGSVRYPWPIEIERSIFHASPALHDVDGDGVQASSTELPAGRHGHHIWYTTATRILAWPYFLFVFCHEQTVGGCWGVEDVDGGSSA